MSSCALGRQCWTRLEAWQVACPLRSLEDDKALWRDPRKGGSTPRQIAWTREVDGKWSAKSPIALPNLSEDFLRRKTKMSSWTPILRHYAPPPTIYLHLKIVICQLFGPRVFGSPNTKSALCFLPYNKKLLKRAKIALKLTSIWKCWSFVTNKHCHAYWHYI